MSRYLDADDSLENTFYKVLQDRHPGFVNIKFKLMYDSKKRMKKGKLVLASTELTNEKVKHFTADEKAPEGYDYIVIVDQVAWEYAKEPDRIRLVSHELSHVFIDEKGKYRLLDHDVEDFLSEIKLNEDAPDWAYELAYLTESIYEQQNS